MARRVQLCWLAANSGGLTGVFQMAKMLRMMARVAENKIADALEALAGIADGVTFQTADTAIDVPDVDDVDPPVVAKRPALARRVSAAPSAAQPVRSTGRTRLAGKVIYTPAGTQRQIDKMLADLRGVNNMRALVLRDLAKHPGSSNKEVRARIAKAADKAGLSVESVDNTIWTMVNGKLLTKESASAE